MNEVLQHAWLLIALGACSLPATPIPATSSTDTEPDTNGDANHGGNHHQVDSGSLTDSGTAPVPVWYGVDYVDGVDGVSTNCGDYSHPVDGLFGADDPVQVLIDGYGGWGAGVGEFGPAASSAFTGADAEFLFDSCVGAVIQNDFGIQPRDFYAFPVALDHSTFQARVDSDGYVGVPPAHVETTTAVATAWYRINGFYFYTVDGVGGSGFVPDHLLVQAELPYDAESASLVDAQTAYGAVSPAIYLEFGTQTWADVDFDASYTAQYCVFVLPLTDSTPASWAR